MKLRARTPAVWVILWITGCVDTTPQAFVPPNRPDAGPTIADAGVADGADAAPATPIACQQCVLGDDGACRATYEQCANTEGCPELVQCLFGDGCFTLSDLEARISCGQPCFDELGVVSGLQPELQAAIPLNACTQNECRAECIRE